MPLPLKAFLYAGLIFGVLDGLWLGLVAKTFYASQLGDLMRARIGVIAAGAFYVLFIAGLVVFTILPALESGGWMRAALLGGLLGLVAYGTYDLTNLATLKGWPMAMSLVDMAWGAALSAAVAAATVMLVKIL